MCQENAGVTRERVLIIHGTFNAPKEGEVQWYQLPEGEESQRKQGTTFASRLKRLLAERGMPDAVSKEDEWRWDGANSHEGRLKASAELTTALEKLAEQDPSSRFHFVAHSHGGNVLLSALHRRSFRLKVGRVVFMGTPFLRRYRTRRSQLAEFSRVLVDLVLGVPLACVYLYLMCAVGWFALSWTPWVPDFPTDPRRWPLWVVIPFFLFFLILLLNILTVAVRWSSNLYYPRWQPSAGGELPPSVDGRGSHEALVVCAPYLDEAVVGLSSAPIAIAAITPPLRALLCPRPSFDRSVDLGSAEPLSVANGARQAIAWSVRLGYFVVWPLWWLLYRVVVERAALKVVERLYTSMSLGLPGRLLRGSSIRVSPRLNEPRAFRERFWDVTRLVGADLPRSRKTSEDGESSPRPEYLWDDDRLRELIDDDRPREVRDDPRGESVGFLDASQLERVIRRRMDHDVEVGSVVEGFGAARLGMFRRLYYLDHRLKEIFGNVQLDHSGYYASRPIAEAVADFIAHGQAPADAEPTDEDDQLTDRHSPPGVHSVARHRVRFRRLRPRGWNWVRVPGRG